MITVADIDTALEDERHNGWGYATRRVLPAGKRAKLDRAVARVATQLGLTKEDLFRWTDSKNGRWLVDDASGNAPTQALVRRHLNLGIVLNLADEQAEVIA